MAKLVVELTANQARGCWMRRMLVVAIVAGVLAGTTGCARYTPSGATPATGTPTGNSSAGVEEVAVYVAVLRRYLSTPAENSFPERTFKAVYVLDHAHPDAGDPRGKLERGTPIAPHTQRQITAALAGVAQVSFIASRETVIETKDGCAHVTDGGILITLGTVNGDDHEVQVPITGFVACLGATWLTYVVQNQPGTGWWVTGTTGSIAIA